MTSYSYKPISGGLVGASTVVPLKEGRFLEVRRGEKTRWDATETRQTWSSLDEWKATLPADATVVEKSNYSKPVPESSWSADFKTAIEAYKSVDHYMPVHSGITVDSNTTRAEKLLLRAKKIVRKIGRTPLSEAYTKAAHGELIATAVERHICHKYNYRYYSLAIKVQRISDDAFIPLFFDLKRCVMHTPILDEKRFLVCKEGTTFAELGVRPVFLMLTRKETPSFRLITLETIPVGGAGSS